MTGWRLGFVVGNKDVLAGLGKVKSNLDSGVFEAVQAAGITAVGLDEGVTDAIRRIYQERRDTLVPGLKAVGLDVDTPPAAFYVWVAVPKGYRSASFTEHLLEKAGIVTTPGNGFGAPGEGYVRMTVCTSKERLSEAVERIKKTGW
jgi:LL-diaminopimelate aminotransferase